MSRDIGGSLRHEFFHLMHYGHMERIGQAHPLWIQEGLAALYEDYDLGESGSITFLPNDRQHIVMNRAKAGLLTKWNDLMTLSADEFMEDAQELYPQVRSIFEFVAAQGKLEQWYATYVKTFNDDLACAIREAPSAVRPIAKCLPSRGQIRSIDYVDGHGVEIKELSSGFDRARSFTPRAQQRQRFIDHVVGRNQRESVLSKPRQYIGVARVGRHDARVLRTRINKRGHQCFSRGYSTQS